MSAIIGDPDETYALAGCQNYEDRTEKGLDLSNVLIFSREIIILCPLCAHPSNLCHSFSFSLHLLSPFHRVLTASTIRNMASDSSDSPMLLTPESTGTTSGLTIDTSSPESPTASSTSSISATKKARRQTAFYPNMNASNKQQKPFSRSAAKRESVMALGSIEHLQHYFTKTGLAAKKK